MRFILIFLLGAFLVGCGQQTSVVPTNNNPRRFSALKRFVLETNQITPSFGYWANSDANYLLPTKFWITNEFLPRYKQYILKERIGPEIETFDCEDYAREASALAARLFYKSSPRQRNVAFLMGEVSYIKSNFEPHAINFTVIEDRVGPHTYWEMVFIDCSLPEPQIIKLDPTEKQRILFWKF